MDYQQVKSEQFNAGAWVEVNLDAISENFDTVRSIIGQGRKICAVVKADAYGHGSAEVARLLEKKGADYFAVAVLDEGIELRKMNIRKPILVLGPLMPGQASYILRYELVQTIVSYETALELSKEAVYQKKTVKIHIKVDTGMGRIGMYYEDALEEIKKIRALPGIEIEGIFTHFATADSEDKSYVNEQYRIFCGVLDSLRDAGIHIPIAHAATSSAIIDTPYMSLDMVRPGLMLYGLYPRRNMREKLELKPALTLKARISYLKTIKKDRSISYGRRYYAKEGDKIATIPIGYHDGFRRLLTNNSEVIIGGKKCPVVGTVCMDHVMAEVSDIENVKVYDEAVIIGSKGDQEITAEEVAERLDTIIYEVISTLGKRLPRIYRKQGFVVAVRNLLGYHSLHLVAQEAVSHIEAEPVTSIRNFGNAESGKTRGLMRT